MKTVKIRQDLLKKMTKNLSKNTEKLRELENSSELNSRLEEDIKTNLMKKYTCVDNCKSTNTVLYYCKNCKQTHPICKRHFSLYYRNKKCAVCGESSITRRWTIPVPL